MNVIASASVGVYSLETCACRGLIVCVYFPWLPLVGCDSDMVCIKLFLRVCVCVWAFAWLCVFPSSCLWMSCVRWCLWVFVHMFVTVFCKLENDCFSLSVIVQYEFQSECRSCICICFVSLFLYVCGCLWFVSVCEHLAHFMCLNNSYHLLYSDPATKRRVRNTWAYII